jgi:hypothetical protein
MTKEDVIAQYNQFFKDWNGKPLEAEDPTNLDQCFDEPIKFCDYLGIPREAIRHFYASQIYTNPTDLTVQYFEMIPNTPNGVPQIGDIIVWKIGLAGHVAIGTGVGDSSGFTSFDQNWPLKSPCHLQAHTYDNVFGWLRPRTVQPIVATPVTENTIIPWGADWGSLELQALRSKVQELKEKIIELTNQLSSNQNHGTIVIPITSDTPSSAGVPTAPSALSRFLAFLFGWLKRS